MSYDPYEEACEEVYEEVYYDVTDEKREYGIGRVVERRRRQIGRVSTLVFFVGAAILVAEYRMRLSGFQVGRDERRLHKRNRKRDLILFVVDDQGYNDFGLQSSDLKDTTPTLNALAQKGAVFTRYYTMHLCTPSRAAMLTGLHPARLGLQHSMVTANQPWGLDLEVKILPTLLPTEYYTVALGKYHLGHYKPGMWPRSRGFDAFVGFLSGFEDYYSRLSEPTLCQDTCFKDFRVNENALDPAPGVYSLDILTEAALSGLHTATSLRRPIALYIALPTVHEPLEPPSDCDYSPPSSMTTRRALFAAMTKATDDMVTKVMKDIELGSTIFCYASDNGGAALPPNAGNNFPLRGFKGYMFEGGVRTHAFITAPGLISPSQQYEATFSVLDWLPTLLEAVDADTKAISTFDGVSHWSALTSNLRQERRAHLLLNADAFDRNAQELVLQVSSNDQDSVPPEWIPTGAIIINETLKFIRNARLLPMIPLPSNDAAYYNDTDIYFNWTALQPQDFLFDLETDPNESHDLSTERPDLFLFALGTFNEVARSVWTTPRYCGVSDDKVANAAFIKNGGFVSAWREDEAADVCDPDFQVPDTPETFFPSLF